MCADCAGFDIEWMYKCDKHRTEYCRGCACPECADEAWDAREEDGPMDLEEQFDRAFEDFPTKQDRPVPRRPGAL